MAEALYFAVRVASFELVHPYLEQAQHRQDLSLSTLQQRFRSHWQTLAEQVEAGLAKRTYRCDGLEPGPVPRRPL